MSLSHNRRRLALATLTLVVWLTMSAAVDWAQLALTAAVACLVGVLATLAIQLVVRHSHRPSMAHA